MESTNGNGIGEEIRALRKELGLTQEQFARAVGPTVATVNRWENGRFKPSKLARRALLDFATQHGVVFPASA